MSSSRESEQMAEYFVLHDIISDLIEDGKLEHLRAQHPDDYKSLVEQLVKLNSFGNRVLRVPGEVSQ